MIGKALIKPFVGEKEFTSDDLSVNEIKVLKDALNSNTSISKEVKESLDFKLKLMIRSRLRATIDDQIVNYIERHNYVHTSYFDFFNISESNKIKICNNNVCVDGNKNTPIDDIVDKFGKEGRYLFDNVKFCSDCGRPVTRGYTNEEDFMCDNAEFTIYMDKVYGQGQWGCGPDGYYYLDNKDGKYKPTGWYKF